MRSAVREFESIHAFRGRAEKDDGGVQRILCEGTDRRSKFLICDSVPVRTGIHTQEDAPRGAIRGHKPPAAGIKKDDGGNLDPKPAVGSPLPRSSAIAGLVKTGRGAGKKVVFPRGRTHQGLDDCVVGDPGRGNLPRGPEIVRPQHTHMGPGENP